MIRERIKNPTKTKEQIVQWIRNYMAENGKEDTPIVIGISGGKDSSVVAALCVEAMGKDRVIGVLLPDGQQKDIDISYALIQHLGIKSYEMNIYDTLIAMKDQFYRMQDLKPINSVYEFNTPARIRMAYLYGVANILGARVANTCNFTESYLGYDTKFGDQCGDFSPLKDILCTDVIRIGEACGLPNIFTHKAPDDGMCGKTDEERFGFTYETADDYLEGKLVDADTTRKIVKMHENALHKNCVFLPHYWPSDAAMFNSCCCSG